MVIALSSSWTKITSICDVSFCASNSLNSGFRPVGGHSEVACRYGAPARNLRRPGPEHRVQCTSSILHRIDSASERLTATTATQSYEQGMLNPKAYLSAIREF